MTRRTRTSREAPLNTPGNTRARPLSHKSTMPHRATMCGGVLPFLLALVHSGITLQPLTKIAPEAVELDAFAQTVVGAIEALRDMKLVDGTHVVAHVVGASGVEAAVDWSPVCATGVTIVLVGPQAVPLTNGGGECVSVVRALYTRAAVGAALGNESPSVSPDVVIALNCDIYHIQWRRSLAELLRLGKPVVATFYCQFEGAEMVRLMRWSDLEFSDSVLAKSDAVARSAHGDSMASGLEPNTMESSTAVPEFRELWRFTRNPHAHAAPRECYSLTTHGVRNAYWMAFIGDSVDVATQATPLKSDL